MTHDEILSRLTGDFKQIALLIGVENALKIAKVFGGVAIAVPRLVAIARIERDREIRREYDHQAKTARKLAFKHQLSTRQIYNILGQLDEEENK
jgi:Mor family transcriptional regulator